MAEQIETVVIGGGHAGLVMSYWLSAAGREHVVLERQRPFERWRTDRWDSLSLIIPNYLIHLPGLENPSTDAEGFLDRAQFMRYLEDYLVFSQPPLRTGVTVTSLEVGSDAWRFQVESDVGTIEAMNVVVATGPYQLPRIPAFAAGIPHKILQLASGQYRNPAQLPPGGVLVVGSGSSGLQIAEELYLAGRDVHVSVGRHRRQPR